jgi:hypothetical protein
MKGSINLIGGKKYFELTDIKFSFEFDEEIIKENIECPDIEDKKEREYLIRSSKDVVYLFKKDINTRQAIFANLYGSGLAKCISFVHYFIRNNILNMNVYQRSQNIANNFQYDYQTYNILLYVMMKELTIKKSIANITVANLHREI